MSRNWLWNVVDLGCRGESDYYIHSQPDPKQGVVASEDMIIRDACFGWKYSHEQGEKVISNPPVQSLDISKWSQEEKCRLVGEAGIDFSNYSMAEFEITVVDMNQDLLIYGGKSNRAMAKDQGAVDYFDFGSSALEHDHIKEIKFSPKGTFVCIIFQNQGPAIWKISRENGKYSKHESVHISNAGEHLIDQVWIGCCWTQDETRLAAVSLNGTIVMISVNQSTPISTATVTAKGKPNRPTPPWDPETPVPSRQELIDFSHDGKHLYLGGDKCVWVHSCDNLSAGFTALSQWERSRFLHHQNPIILCKFMTSQHLVTCCMGGEGFDTQGVPCTTLKIFETQKRLLVYETEFEGEILRVRQHFPMWSLLFNTGVLHIGLLLHNHEPRGQISWEEAKEQEEALIAEELRVQAEKEAAEVERLKKLEEEQALLEIDELTHPGENKDAPNGTKSIGKGDSGTASMRKDPKASKDPVGEMGSGTKKAQKPGRSKKGNKDPAAVKESGEEPKPDETPVPETKPAIPDDNLLEAPLDLDQLINVVGIGSPETGTNKTAKEPDCSNKSVGEVFSVSREKKAKKKSTVLSGEESSVMKAVDEAATSLGKRSDNILENEANILAVEEISKKAVRDTMDELNAAPDNFCLGVTGKLGHLGPNSLLDLTLTSGYICWNSIGKALTKTETYLNQHPLDIEFEHGSKTTFPVPHKYNAAEITSLGILLGSLRCHNNKDAHVKPPHVMFIASQKGRQLVPKGWSHNFPKSTELIAMTMGTHFVALGTQKPNELHLLSTNGVLFLSVAAPGQIISLSTFKDTLLMVYQVGPQQRLRLLNVMLLDVVLDTEVPSDSSATLLWYGVAADLGKLQSVTPNETSSMHNSTGSSDNQISKMIPELDSNTSKNQNSSNTKNEDELQEGQSIQETDQIVWVTDNGRVWSLAKERIWVSKGQIPNHSWVLGAQIVHSADQSRRTLEIHTLDLSLTGNKSEPTVLKAVKGEEGGLQPPEERRILLAGLNPGFAEHNYLQEVWMIGIKRDQALLSKSLWSHTSNKTLPAAKRAIGTVEDDKTRIRIFRKCLLQQNFEDAIATALTIEHPRYFSVCFKLAKKVKIPEEVYTRLKECGYKFGNHRYFEEEQPQQGGLTPTITNSSRLEETEEQSVAKVPPAKSAIKDEVSEPLQKASSEIPKSDVSAAPAQSANSAPQPVTLSSFFKTVDIKKAESSKSSMAVVEGESVAGSSIVEDSPGKKPARSKERKGKVLPPQAAGHRKTFAQAIESERERSVSTPRNKEEPPVANKAVPVVALPAPSASAAGRPRPADPFNPLSFPSLEKSQVPSVTRNPKPPGSVQGAAPQGKGAKSPKLPRSPGPGAEQPTAVESAGRPQGQLRCWTPSAPSQSTTKVQWLSEVLTLFNPLGPRSIAKARKRERGRKARVSN